MLSIKCRTQNDKSHKALCLRCETNYIEKQKSSWYRIYKSNAVCTTLYAVKEGK